MGPPAPRQTPWPFWPAAGAFVLAWAILALHWLSGAVTIPWDAKAHFYPQLQFLAQSLHRGETPFWTPFVFSGSPQIADPQSLVFSPPFLLLAALDPNPSFRAADAAVLGMLALGGLAILAIFRDRAWHWLGGLIAALAFAFGASAAWRIQHVGQLLSLSFLVIALWLLLRALERRSLAFGFLAGAGAGFMVLGRDQVAYLGLWILIGTVLWHWWDTPSRAGAMRASAGPLLLGAIAGALVAAIPVVLTALLSAASNRPEIDLAGAGQGSLHPALLLTAAIPNLFGVDGPFADYWGPPSPRWGPADLFFARNMGVLYIGALPLALVVIGALRGVFWAREARPFTILACVMLLYALGRYTPFFAPAFKLVPGVDFFRRPADATFVLGALGAILAGYAAHRWWTGTLPAASASQRLLEALVLATPFGLGLTLGVAKDTLASAAWPLGKAALCLGTSLVMLATLRRGRLAAAVVITLLAADLFWNNGPNESTALPPRTYAALDPQASVPLLAAIESRLKDPRLDRVELAGLGFHWPNASLVHRLHNVLGYNPVRLKLYSAATGAEDHVALPEQRMFSPLFPSYRSTLADLLGLRLIATGVPIERIDPMLRPGDVTLVGSFEDGFLYENPRALPRVLFATRALAADFDAMLKTGRWPEVDLSRTVLLSPPDIPIGDGGEADNGQSGAALRIASYRNTEVVIEVETPAPGYLVLNDPYHPWWSAEIDGRETDMLQANVVFRAVRVPAGRHVVHFAFRPLRGAWRQLASRLGE